MKVGSKVFCKDRFDEFTGWIASIDDNVFYPYIIVEDMENIGKTYLELCDRDVGAFEVYELESLTLLQNDQCQYCNLTKRELKIVQSELNDAYAMLQNRDNKIKDLEEKTLSAPVIKEETIKVQFTVTATRTQIIKLKEIMETEGIEYE